MRALRNDGGKPVLCAGFSRYRAVSEINARKLAPAPIPLRCTYSQCSEEEGFVTAISENRQRNATTDLDDAYNMKRLMKVYAKTEEEVALVYFPGATGDALKDALKFVKRRLALVNLSPEAERAMRDGRLKGSAAVAIAKLSQEQQAEAIAKAPEGKKIKAPKKAATAKAGSVPPRLWKSLFVDVDTKDLEESDARFVEVPRSALLALHKFLNAA